MAILSMLLLLVAQNPDATQAKPSDADGRLVCKRLTRTGTRMQPKRVCLSGFEWRQTERRAQREVGDIKRQSRMEHVPSF